MPILINNNNTSGGGIDGIYLGSTPIQAAYVGDVKVWEGPRKVVTTREEPIKAGWEKVGTFDDWYWNFEKVTEKQDGVKKVTTTSYYKGDTLIRTKTSEEVIKVMTNGTYKQGANQDIAPYKEEYGTYNGQGIYACTYKHPVTGKEKKLMVWEGNEKRQPVTKTGWGTATYTYPSEWDS